MFKQLADFLAPGVARAIRNPAQAAERIRRIQTRGLLRFVAVHGVLASGGTSLLLYVLFDLFFAGAVGNRPLFHVESFAPDRLLLTLASMVFIMVGTGIPMGWWFWRYYEALYHSLAERLHA